MGGRFCIGRTKERRCGIDGKNARIDTFWFANFVASSSLTIATPIPWQTNSHAAVNCRVLTSVDGEYWRLEMRLRPLLGVVRGKFC